MFSPTGSKIKIQPLNMVPDLGVISLSGRQRSRHEVTGKGSDCCAVVLRGYWGQMVPQLRLEGTVADNEEHWESAS